MALAHLVVSLGILAGVVLTTHLTKQADKAV
jgi:hypothetical protein